MLEKKFEGEKEQKEKMAVENEEVVRNLQSRIRSLGIDTSIYMYNVSGFFFTCIIYYEITCKSTCIMYYRKPSPHVSCTMKLSLHVLCTI